MSELTDDQLDGLFRKSAEEFESPFDPAAWQDMKARLDATDHTKPGGAVLLKNLLRWGLPLLLVLTGGGWYAYQKASSSRQPVAVPPTHAPSTSRNTTTAKKADQHETSRLAGATPQREQPVDLSKPTGSNDGMPPANPTDLRSSNRTEFEPRSGVSGNLTERLPTTVNTKTERATKPALPSYKSVTGRNRGSRSQRVIAVGGIVGRETEGEESPIRKPVAFVKTRSVQQRRSARRSGTSLSATGYAVTTALSFNRRRIGSEWDSKQPTTASPLDAGVQPNTIQSGIIQPGTVQSEASNAPLASSITVSELAIRPAKWPQLSFTDRPVQFQPDRTEQPVVSRPVVQRGLSVRVAIAPDLSGVGLKNFSRPGTNVGLLLEYRFASRWSVQAGLIQSTKVYRASTGQYNYWPEEIMYWKAKPVGVDGTCTMFDIPINVRYDVLLKPRLDNKPPSRWFVSGGITSYYMKQEDYTYLYTDYTHVYSDTMKEVSASTGGYGFSNLNLSVGYERALSRRLSWQVEPFMKVPLKGVGYFKVDLLSTGAFFSLRYKL